MDFAANAGVDDEYITLQDAFEHLFTSTNGFHSALSASGQSQAPEPRSWKEAMRRPDSDLWFQAALEEFNALVENGTFTPVRLAPGQKPIGCRWVFKVKRKADGSVERYKARLVAKGFSQRPGVDFSQVFSPTAKWAALRAILALAALEDLELLSVDISNAFLNGDLEHDVLMAEPEGFEQYGPGFALKLLKALYGLKQAGRQWHIKLNSILVDIMGFQQVKCDHSIWVYRKGDMRIIIPVYVDDMTIAAKSKADCIRVRDELAKHFKLRDLGPTSFLLGVQIQRDRPKRTLTLSQSQYVVDLLDRFGFSDVAPVSTPMDPGLRLTKDMCPKTPSEAAAMRDKPYAQLVGALLYLAIATRPDISYTVGVLARYCANPGQSHWKAAKHLCRYLRGTVGMKLCYAPTKGSELFTAYTKGSDLFTTYTDADHGGDPDGRRSTSGMIVTMGTGAISWASKLQSIVTLSTTEAEYVAAVQAGQEILWLRNLLSEFGYTFDKPSTLFIDNQSALQVARNPEHHGRMKHLDLRFYWLRDVVEQGLVEPKYLQTDDMPADLMTKALGRNKVVHMREMLGLRE